MGPKLTAAEGYILDIGANMFKIAGPVIVYGTAASVVYGVIYWIFINKHRIVFSVGTNIYDCNLFRAYGKGDRITRLSQSRIMIPATPHEWWYSRSFRR